MKRYLSRLLFLSVHAICSSSNSQESTLRRNERRSRLDAHLEGAGQRGPAFINVPRALAVDSPLPTLQASNRGSAAPANGMIGPTGKSPAGLPKGSSEYLAVLREGAGPYLALVRAGKLSTQEALDLMRDNKEHLAVVRTMKRTLIQEHKARLENDIKERAATWGEDYGESACADGDEECRLAARKARKAAWRRDNPTRQRSWTDKDSMGKLQVAQTLFGDGTHADILAFTHDATVAMVAASRSSEIRADAQRRVGAAASGSAVWFKHMRKAGGSSVRAALEEAFYAQKKHAGARSSKFNNGTFDKRQSLEERSDRRRLTEVLGNSTNSMRRNAEALLTMHGRRLERSYEHKREKALAQTGGDEFGFTLHHQEFDLFPVKCLILEPRTVYITAIRQPVNRFISLFYYDGPGAKNPNASAKEWFTWMDDGIKLLQFEPGNLNGRLRKAFTGAYSYLPDYHARSLTAQCVASGGANSCGRANFGQSDFGTPGCRIKKYTTVDLELAKAAVAAFDLVLVVEQFDLQGPSLLLQRTVGIPNLWLGHARTNSRKHNPPPTEVIARLQSENAADTALHAYATELSNAALKDLEADLKRRHGANMGGYAPFEPIGAMGGDEGRRRCLDTCRNTYANRGFEARYKRKCCKVCYFMHPSDQELIDGVVAVSRHEGDELLKAVKEEFQKEKLKQKVLDEQAEKR